MFYKGIKVEDISLVIYLKERAVKNWKVNERYTSNKVAKLGFNNFGVENPIDDMVYIQFDNKDWSIEIELLSTIYKELSDNFEEVKVNLYLDDFIDEIGNSVDVTLEEFLDLLK